MGANRLGRVLKRPSAPSVWTVTQPPSLAAVAHPTGAVDVFSFPSGRRPSFKSPHLPSSVGIPTSLSLRPPSAPPSLPLTVTGTNTGHILLDSTVIANVGAAPVLCTHYTKDIIVVAGGTLKEVVTINPVKREVLHRFSLQMHHVSPISAVAVLDARRAVFCSQSITLVDLNTGDLLVRYMGHKSPVTSVCTFPHAGLSHFATASDDTYVSIWRADGSDSGKKRTAEPDERLKRRRTTSRAVGMLVAPPSGIQLLSVDEGDGTSVNIAAVLRNGDVSVWRRCQFETGKVGKTPLAPKYCSFTVRGCGSSFIAAFSKQGELGVLYGNLLKPTGHTLSVGAVSDDEKVSLPPSDSNVFMADIKAGVSNSKVRLLGASKRVHINGAVPAEETAVGGTVKRKQNGVVHGVVHGDGDESGSEELVPDRSREIGLVKPGNKKRAGAAVDPPDEIDNDEPSIQDKLAALGLASGKANEVLTNTNAPSVLDATLLDSRVGVLLQALQSRDSKLFDSCLKNAVDLSVIQNTVARIPASLASGVLLEMLVERLRVRPNRAETLSRWIREVLMEHASAIITRKRNEAIASLASVIEARTRALDCLTRLQGRLELVCRQSERLQQGRANIDEAMAEYVEEEAESDDSSSGEEDGESDEEGESSEDGDEDDGDSGSKSSGSSSEDEDLKMVPRKSSIEVKGDGHTNGNMEDSDDGSQSSDDSDSDDSEDDDSDDNNQGEKNE